MKSLYFGIDPGIQTTGWGVVNDKGQKVGYGIITTDAREGLPSRLDNISRQLRKLLSKYDPYAIGIEKVFFRAEDMTDVVQARGVLLHCAYSCCSKIVEVPAYTVKSHITGYARATKRQMQVAIRDTLKLKYIPQPDDAADGLGIALYTLSILGPQAHAN